MPLKVHLTERLQSLEAFFRFLGSALDKKYGAKTKTNIPPENDALADDLHLFKAVHSMYN
jgi:hypothetical protein